MRITQNERTLHDVLRYIKTRSNDGILKQSMMKMGKEMGYSNATVHRSLKALESRGMIQVIETRSPRKPNTICYIGPDEDDVSDLLHRADVALADLFKATDQVTDVMAQLRETIGLLQPNEPYMHIH